MGNKIQWLAKNKRQLAWDIIKFTYMPFQPFFWKVMYEDDDEFDSNLMYNIVCSFIVVSFWLIVIIIPGTIFFPIIFLIFRHIQQNCARKFVIKALRGKIG